MFMSESILPTEVKQKLLWLRTLLDNLPNNLPTPQRGEIPKYPFATFRPDVAFLQRTEDEVGAINETMKVIFGWKTRTTGDGIITSGKNGIGTVADLLENYLKKHRDGAGQPNAVLVKWVEDISKGCEKAIKSYGGELPDIPITSTKCRAEAKDSDSEASPIEKSKKRSRNNNNNKPDSSEIIS
ncbi:hypothetical protein EV359DRAFT_68177 [Lentinula novae-zelandiae]|nr:hypothetical protein EV359DRAFT_68177 [Lentinula novae-zelandiae]